MSKPYRIRIQDVVSAEDSSTFHVDPVPLMSPTEFGEILAQVLQEDGWVPNEEGKLTKPVSETMRYIFDPERMQILTQVEGQEQVEQTIEEWSQESADKKAQQVIDTRSESLRRRITQELEETSDERRLACEALVVEATGRAIKEAAERLGDVRDIHEDRGEGGKYRLTIMIEERE